MKLPKLWQHINVQPVQFVKLTRRPASAALSAHRQFQATGQPVSRTQASDAVTSRLPRYEAKCVQRRCFQWGLVPLRSDQGNGATPCQYTDTTRKAIDCATTLLLRVFYNETLQKTFHPLLSKLSERRHI